MTFYVDNSDEIGVGKPFLARVGTFQVNSGRSGIDGCKGIRYAKATQKRARTKKHC
jgi:hypothetical protein